MTTKTYLLSSMVRSTWISAFCLPFILLSGLASAAPNYIDTLSERSPMDLDGIPSKIADILSRYYDAAFGGSENWAKINDFRLQGSLKLPEGEVSFLAYLKKPAFYKVILFGDYSGELVMAFDGTDAWQTSPGSRQAQSMPSDAAADFIRDSLTGGHLLYPNLPGKRIELLGKGKVGDSLCHTLRVTLPDGQEVTYLIDARTGLERQKITTSRVTGEEEIVTHHEWKRVEDAIVITQSTMAIKGKAQYTSYIEQAAINVSLVDSMFQRPPKTAVPTSGNINTGGPFSLPQRSFSKDNWKIPSGPFNDTP